MKLFNIFIISSISFSYPSYSASEIRFIVHALCSQLSVSTVEPRAIRRKHWNSFFDPRPYPSVMLALIDPVARMSCEARFETTASRGTAQFSNTPYQKDHPPFARLLDFCSFYVRPLYILYALYVPVTKLSRNSNTFSFRAIPRL